MRALTRHVLCSVLITLLPHIQHRENCRPFLHKGRHGRVKYEGCGSFELTLSGYSMTPPSAGRNMHLPHRSVVLGVLGQHIQLQCKETTARHGTGIPRCSSSGGSDQDIVKSESVWRVVFCRTQVRWCSITPVISYTPDCVLSTDWKNHSLQRTDEESMHHASFRPLFNPKCRPVSQSLRLLPLIVPAAAALRSRTPGPRFDSCPDTAMSNRTFVWRLRGTYEPKISVSRYLRLAAGCLSTFRPTMGRPRHSPRIVPTAMPRTLRVYIAALRGAYCE